MNLTFFINWRSNRWEILKMFAGRLSANWAWEFNWYATHSWIMVDIALRPQDEHRGLFIMLGLLGRAVDLNIYNTALVGIDTDEE